MGTTRKISSTSALETTPTQDLGPTNLLAEGNMVTPLESGVQVMNLVGGDGLLVS